jgi:hypothetical protein
MDTIPTSATISVPKVSAWASVATVVVCDAMTVPVSVAIAIVVIEAVVDIVTLHGITFDRATWNFPEASE